MSQFAIGTADDFALTEDKEEANSWLWLRRLCRESFAQVLGRTRCVYKKSASARATKCIYCLVLCEQ